MDIVHTNIENVFYQKPNSCQTKYPGIAAIKHLQLIQRLTLLANIFQHQFQLPLTLLNCLYQAQFLAVLSMIYV